MGSFGGDLLETKIRELWLKEEIKTLSFSIKWPMLEEGEILWLRLG